MHTSSAYHRSLRNVRRFSGAMQSWFPEIHQKTFPGIPGSDVVVSAVQRTMRNL